MADLLAMQSLLSWMREEGVDYARCGDIELRISRPRPSVTHADETDAKPISEEQERRAHLEMLFHSSGANPDLFLTRRAP